MMNNSLPLAPPQLKDRVKPEHWASFIDELNACGTPNADCLLSCGIFLSCTCCFLFPKIKHEFEDKVDKVLREHREKFAPHVTAMARAETNINIWTPSTDPLQRGQWNQTTVYYVAIECTESGWVPPKRDDKHISELEKMTAYV